MEKVSAKSALTLIGNKRTKSHPKPLDAYFEWSTLYFEKVLGSFKYPITVLRMCGSETQV